VAGGVLSYAAALSESFTADEPIHLTAGASYLATGDYRLNPEHPPLAKMWAALALAAVPHAPFSPEIRGWPVGEARVAALDWLGRRNDGNRLLRAPRLMMVFLAVALVGTVGWVAAVLFGPKSGLIAMALAAFEPLLLAHGHYVTTDVPVTLLSLLVLIAAARFLERPTVVRWSALAASLSAAALVKYSWVLVLPVLLLMAVAAFLRRPAGAAFGAPAWAFLAALPLIVVLAIWAAYGFRYHPSRPGDPASPTAESWRSINEAPVPLFFSPATREEAWRDVLHVEQGNARQGLSVALVSAARRFRLLPEAYLYGFAYASGHSERRLSYLHGRFSDSGWKSYFLVAYLVKTPLPEIFLLLAGATAILSRRAPIRGSPLLALGLVAFSALYATTAVFTSLNIGLRHFLPVYPGLFVVASASAAWTAYRPARIAVGIAMAGLALTALLSYPFYLGYFNEIAGGWRNGHRWLVDSNLDWDQDFLRLRDYQREHPEERIVFLPLLETPLPSGLSVEYFVPKSAEQKWPRRLSAGTYVFSATWLVGTLQPFGREETWERPAVRDLYARLWERWNRETAPSQEGDPERWSSWVRFDGLRRALLLRRLQQRPPDDRLGTSSFLFRLSDRELEELTRPP
jgi:4-amino-4-deoxy-L-arabinose transferase-like glycosyltransferase